MLTDELAVWQYKGGIDSRMSHPRRASWKKSEDDHEPRPRCPGTGSFPVYDHASDYALSFSPGFDHDVARPTGAEGKFSRQRWSMKTRRERSAVPSQQFSSPYHAPVLVEETLHWLDIEPGGRYLDGTAGGGGHSEAILLKSSPDGKLLALDRDPQAIAQVKQRLEPRFADRLHLVQANYSEAARVLKEQRWEKVDGWLIDAGVSSHQLDEAERGFSFQQEGPLDMRMGPDSQTVAELFDEVDDDELTQILRDYGEVRGGRRVARAILEAHKKGGLKTTTDLADVVVANSPPRHRKKGRRLPIHPATLVFQALRIAVNRELDHLIEAVRQIPQVVRPGGRAVFISFHSLEDRIVKLGFRNLQDPCTCPRDFPRCACGKVSQGEVLTRRPIMASDEEVASNPRARSAKLRAFQVASA